MDERYDDWVELATITATGECGGAVTPPPSSTVEPSEPATTSSITPPETGVPVPDEEFDYVIVGSGAGGIPLADKLSEAGHKVLLIEKGPPSSGRWGGTLGPAWLEDTNLTRFDVPGLCNEIWHDSAGIACRDTDQMAGCVLGGGTAINAALWWRVSEDLAFDFPYFQTAVVLTRLPLSLAVCCRLGLQLPRRLEVLGHGWCRGARLRSHPRHYDAVDGWRDLPHPGHGRHP